jgi:creatinine amidohydrolase
LVNAGLGLFSREYYEALDSFSALARRIRPMSEVVSNRMTAAELHRAAPEDAIVLLPVTSTEQHGPHLATGVDTFLADEGCRRIALLVARKRPIIVAPTVWMGLAEHHVAFGGTFSISMSTYHALLRDLCDSILRAGFKRILIVNSHGGNTAALKALSIDLTQELKAPIAITGLYWLPHEANAFAAIRGDRKAVHHACEAETSMMMAAFGDCVRWDKLGEAFGPIGPAAEMLLVWKSFKDLTSSGLRGDARRATAEKGEKLFEIAVGLLPEKLIAGAPWD